MSDHNPYVTLYNNLWFHFTCQSIVHMVAPVKSRQSKLKSEPWLNEMTHSVKCECCRAEHQWKKDRLEISFQMLKDCWHHYQKTVEAAKRKSDIILSNFHKLCILFKTIDSVLNPPKPLHTETSSVLCENLLTL